MSKQRICIVGDGLAGLMTAVVLGRISGVDINLIAKKEKKNLDKRTTAISHTNFKFIQENIVKLDNNLFWPSKNIELYYETSKEKINFLNLNEAHSNLMYVFENDKIKSILLKEISKNKIKKDKIHGINLEKNIDILSHVSNHNSMRPKLVIGFAAETDNLDRNALSKLESKNCDWIIGNDISKKNIGFDSDFNEVTIYYKNDVNQKDKIFYKEKSKVSEEIVDRIVTKFN